MEKKEVMQAVTENLLAESEAVVPTDTLVATKSVATPPSLKAEVLAALSMKNFGSNRFYFGKIQPTEETKLQSRSKQDRSKYLGNGDLRPESEMSETDKAKLALIKQNVEMLDIADDTVTGSADCGAAENASEAKLD